MLFKHHWAAPFFNLTKSNPASLAALSPSNFFVQATVESRGWKINACRDPSGWPRVEKLGHRAEPHRAHKFRIEAASTALKIYGVVSKIAFRKGRGTLNEERTRLEEGGAWWRESLRQRRYCRELGTR